MVRHTTTLLALGLCIAGVAQEQPFAARGLYLSTASIGPGFMLNEPLTNIYVTGDARYFLEDRITLDGSLAWFVGSQQDSSMLLQNSRLSFGPAYHWAKGRMDLGLGFLPGVSFAQVDGEAPDAAALPLKALPHLSLNGSATYYVWKYMHFFANVRYVHAEYPTGPGGSVPLNELVVTAGLGWQVRFWKRAA